MIAHCKGTDIHYTLAGEGPGRVALLHGWGASAALMQPVADGLSDVMRVLSVDFPPFGESGRPSSEWGVPEYAEALLELLEQLDFLPCSVIAHSFGGRVAIWLASGDHSLFDRLILTGAAGIRKPQTEEARKRSEEFRRMKRLCELAKKARVFGPLPERLEAMLREKYGSADYNALDEEMRRTFVKVVNLDLSGRLKEIRQPTLLIWGEKDTETPLWMGRQMERDIPDAGLVVFEGGTHFAYLEQVRRFNTIARSFLTGE